MPGYEDFELFAEGSMGHIYRGKDLNTGKTVAYKMIHPDRKDDKWSLSCLRKEFEFSKKFENVNLVKAHRWIRDGPGFIMDFILGEELKYALSSRLYTFKDRIVVVLGICDALGYMHEKMQKPILHLDIKPENVIVRTKNESEKFKRSHVVLLDYGTSQEMIKGPKILSLRGIKDILSDQKVIGGSFLYMSPEQSRVENLDIRSDIYSLGCLMYELFTGQLPFESNFTQDREEGSSVAPEETTIDRHELKVMHIQEIPKVPSEVNPKISPVLSKIIMRCLQKKPNNRYASITELSMDLQRLSVF